MSCVRKCLHLVICNCVVNWLMGHYCQCENIYNVLLKASYACTVCTPQRQGHMLFASVQEGAAHLANCFHAHKIRRAHTFVMRIEILQKSLSAVVCVCVAANRCQDKFEVLSFIPSLDWTAPGSPAHSCLIISLALCHFRTLPCCFHE